MVRNAKLVGQSIISYLQKKGYPEVCNKSLIPLFGKQWNVSHISCIDFSSDWPLKKTSRNKHLLSSLKIDPVWGGLRKITEIYQKLQNLEAKFYL